MARLFLVPSSMTQMKSLARQGGPASAIAEASTSITEYPANCALILARNRPLASSRLPALITSWTSRMVIDESPRRKTAETMNRCSAATATGPTSAAADPTIMRRRDASNGPPELIACPETAGNPMAALGRGRTIDPAAHSGPGPAASSIGSRLYIDRRPRPCLGAPWPH